MSLLSNNLLVGAGTDGYQISRSLRFNSADSAYLNKVIGAGGTNTKHAVSFWMKRSNVNTGFYSVIYGAQFDANNYIYIYLNSTDKISLYWVNSGVVVLNLQSTLVLRDPSAWYHVYFAQDTTQATAANRFRIWINGVEVTSWSLNTNTTTQNTGTPFGGNNTHEIGRDPSASSAYFNGYITEFHDIWQPTTLPLVTDFGETDTITGVWKPKKYTGTYGTNGFYLPFSTNTLSTDLTSAATLTAPFGGTANNAKVADSVYVTSNTTTGTAFTLVQQDLAVQTQVTRYSITKLWFTGGSSTWVVRGSNDASTWTNLATLSVTGTSADYSGSINANYRYYDLRATSFGTNGQGNVDAFILYQDGLGLDSSGNGNNWTPNNFSVTAGAGNDSMIDTPTPYVDGGNGRGNYATLNPLDIYAGSLSNGNLEFSGLYSSQNGIGCRSTLAVPSSGKWYAEAAAVLISGVGNSCMLGFTSSNQSISATAFGATLTPWIGVDASINGNGLRLVWNGVSGGTASSTTLFATYASGDVVNFAIDFDNGKLWIGKNGTWYNSGNPAAGTNATTTFTAGTSPWRFWAEYVASLDNSNRSGVISNFGQRAFAYTPPSGFLALNTQNLPDPTIKKPSTYMDVVTYTGTGAALTPTSSLGFSPDLVWIKSRSAATDHALYDAVRGVEKRLESNTTDAEVTSDGGVTALNSNGFTLGTLAQVNTNTATYAAWCWDESATPGFDIVTYTGDGTSGRDISHSLGVAPSMIITKARNDATYSWHTWHVGIGADYYLGLNTTSARDNSVNIFPYAGITSTTFRTATSAIRYNNLTSVTYVAYLWSEVAGFSKFGSYTGNNSTDGPFVHCGFAPKWIMIKSSTNSATPWQIFDSVRETGNTIEQTLVANGSNAEPYDTASPVDFLSNGFKLRGSSSSYNNYNTGTWIFAAFAETPAKYSLAR